jgi:hypothetical protein
MTSLGRKIPGLPLLELPYPEEEAEPETKQKKPSTKAIDIAPAFEPVAIWYNNEVKRLIAAGKTGKATQPLISKATAENPFPVAFRKDYVATTWVNNRNKRQFGNGGNIPLVTYRITASKPASKQESKQKVLTKYEQFPIADDAWEYDTKPFGQNWDFQPEEYLLDEQDRKLQDIMYEQRQRQFDAGSSAASAGSGSSAVSAAGAAVVFDTGSAGSASAAYNPYLVKEEPGVIGQLQQSSAADDFGEEDVLDFGGSRLPVGEAEDHGRPLSPVLAFLNDDDDAEAQGSGFTRQKGKRKLGDAIEIIEVSDPKRQRKL